MTDDAVAFIAGATGYTGREVARLLARDGYRVVAHVRPDSPGLEATRRELTELGAEVDSTPWRAAAMRDTLRRLRPALVFALLGTTRKRGRAAELQGREETYETVDYGLTALLLRAVEAAAPDARFVYLSSIGVSEATKNPYLAARQRIERELRASDVDFVVARPSLITGPDRRERRPTERLAALATDAALRLAPTRVRRRYGSRTATELAAALVRIALDPDLSGAIVESEDL